MATIKVKELQRFAEVEYCMQRYFDGNIAPIMKSVRNDLTHKQTKELAQYQSSTQGILAQFAAGMSNNIAYNPMDTLKVTGEWNSKTAEDYVEMCKTNLLKNKNLQSDLIKLADEWRTTVVKEIGRERYDAISKELNCDLAFAYVDYRVDQMMIDYMVKQEMPKSSFEYVLRKGAEGSLLGLASTLTKSPLQEEIDRRGEAAYKPSAAEKGAGKAVSFGADIITTGGFSSWGAVAKLGATEVVFSGIESALEKKAGKNKQLTVEQCISKGLWGTTTNVFEAFRKRSNGIVSYENNYVLTLNKGLKNKMSILTKKPEMLFDWMDTTKNTKATNNIFSDPFSFSANNSKLQSPFNFTTLSASNNTATTQRNPNVPLVVAPGHEEEYLEFQKQQKTKQTQQQTAQTATEEPAETTQTEVQQVEAQQPETLTNEYGWANLLQNFGLDGISDVGKNLPYVIAMLPDMLVGMFTGKTQSIGLKKDMIPIASILMGMFVDNPLLKMVLIGMGGANLFNKVGHEAIDRENAKQQQYKQYADETLNPRIVNPVVQGNTLVATIDNVPCSVTITDNAAQAYAAGALPLNTLANAVLAKYDQSYSINNTQNIDINTTVNHDRGLTLR